MPDLIGRLFETSQAMRNYRDERTGKALDEPLLICEREVPEFLEYARKLQPFGVMTREFTESLLKGGTLRVFDRKVKVI